MHCPAMTMSQATLKKLLRYSPDTGEFFWLATLDARQRHLIGSRAGHKNKVGYWIISIGGKKFKAARLAWLYMTGQWPRPTVDHKDRDRGNDAWKNLQEASQRDQVLNSAPRLRAKCYFRDKRAIARPWIAQYGESGGTRRYLGCFATEAEAAAAYQQAKTKSE